MPKIKLIFVKSFLSVIRGFSGLGKKIVKLAKRISPPFVLFLKKFIWAFVYPLYKTYVFFKRRLGRIYTPAKSKIFSVLNKKYVIHILMVTLTLFVFVGNINAQETRSKNIGENSVVFSLFNDEFAYTLVEEKALVNPEETILSYLDTESDYAGSAVYDKAQILESDLVENIATITEGGSAVIRINVSEKNIVSTATRSSNVNHVVAEGETVSVIAERYGVSTNTILWANNLSSRSLIRPGMELDILPVTGILHKVTSGETVKSLSRKYDIDEDKIIEYNNLSNDGRINIGQALTMPGGRKITTVASRNYATTNTSSSSSISKIFSPTVKGSGSGTGKMLWPTSWRVITQYYNWRHTGLDIDGDYNSPIYASADGVVSRDGWGTGYGNMYIVDHGGGVQTLYAHLSKQFAKKGDVVKRGDVLGMMGTTGWSTGTHIHFEVRINGVKKNPLSYIK